MTEQTVIRCSALSSWCDCERRSAARLFRPEIEAAGFTLRRIGRGIGALVGTAVHRGAEVPLRELARSGSLPPVSVATDAAVQMLSDQLQEGSVEYDGPRGVTHTPREAERQTLAMTTSYHRNVAPKVEPLAIEERLEAQIEPGLILSGQPDVIAREPHAIRDLKTGARPPGTFAAQLGGYSLLARSNGLDIGWGRIDFLRRVPVTRPQPDPVTREVPILSAETAAASIVRRIADSLRTFRRGDPERRIPPGDVWSFTANPASMLCDRKWCQAWGTSFCSEWSEK